MALTMNHNFLYPFSPNVAHFIIIENWFLVQVFWSSKQLDEHSVIYCIFDIFLWLKGNKVFGIKVVDHESFIRYSATICLDNPWMFLQKLPALETAGSTHSGLSEPCKVFQLFPFIRFEIQSFQFCFVFFNSFLALFSTSS